MIHVINGTENAERLKDAISLDDTLQGEIITLHDNPAFGPLSIENNDEYRKEWYSSFQFDLSNITLNQEALASLLRSAVEQDEPVCLWIAPNAWDICTYYQMTYIFRKHPGLFHTIQIIGLPFLNEKGQLFYPTYFHQIPAKEFSKTKRLIKEVSTAEYEVDGDEWIKLASEHSLLRMYEGGKKIVSKEATILDNPIIYHTGDGFAKASKIVQEVMKKNNLQYYLPYLQYRTIQLIEQGILIANDTNKSWKDIEIKRIITSIQENTDTEISLQ
jgi:Domain of unknown function (DUF1835).